jgi:hypothetical protein
MTNSLYFDCDCISAFLWVNEQNLLTTLYHGRIVISKPTYDELSYPTTPHLKYRIDQLIRNKQVSLSFIDIDSDTYIRLRTSRKTYNNKVDILPFFCK